MFLSNICNLFKKEQKILLRSLSAVVLVGVLLAAILNGFPFFHLLVLLISFCISYELLTISKLVKAIPFSCSIVFLQVVCYFLDIKIEAIAAVALIISLIIFFASIHVFKEKRNIGKYSLLGLSLAYVFVSTYFIVNLYEDFGYQFMIWLFCCIWLTDTFAFFFGKFIGGAKLAPKISPGKTWVGFFGGTLSAVFISMLVSFFCFDDWIAVCNFIFFTLLVSLGGHIGDLAESAFKRFFGVKDMGNLIPGHGGFSDRFDSFLMASFILFLVKLVVYFFCINYN